MSKCGIEGYAQGPAEQVQAGEIRKFDTGATRDSEDGKFDYEGFLSPLVLERYAAYMHKHRRQSDGTVRDSDNWQKGMPLKVYVKSLVRHVIDLWKLWRGYTVTDLRTGLPVDIEDSACAILFNVMGFLQARRRDAFGKSNYIRGLEAEEPIRRLVAIAHEVNKTADEKKWPSHRPVSEGRVFTNTPTPKGWHNHPMPGAAGQEDI